MPALVLEPLYQLDAFVVCIQSTGLLLYGWSQDLVPDWVSKPLTVPLHV